MPDEARILASVTVLNTLNGHYKAFAQISIAGPTTAPPARPGEDGCVWRCSCAEPGSGVDADFDWDGGNPRFRTSRLCFHLYAMLTNSPGARIVLHGDEAQQRIPPLWAYFALLRRE